LFVQLKFSRIISESFGELPRIYPRLLASSNQASWPLPESSPKLADSISCCQHPTFSLYPYLLRKSHPMTDHMRIAPLVCLDRFHDSLCDLALISMSVLITEINRIQLVLFGIHSRTSSPYAAARILMSTMAGGSSNHWSRLCNTVYPRWSRARGADSNETVDFAALAPTTSRVRQILYKWSMDA
jgi:hypothetical protein